MKKMVPAETELLRVLRRRYDEAIESGGRTITRIAVACEAERDGFWLASRLTRHGIVAHVVSGWPRRTAARGARRLEPGLQGGTAICFSHWNQAYRV